MGRFIKMALAGLVAGVLMTGGAMAAADGKSAPIKNGDDHPLPEVWSGYKYSKTGTQQTQDDEFDNPANLWTEQGAALWTKVDGDEKKACQSCHNDAKKTMKGVATRYPVYYKLPGKSLSILSSALICAGKII